VSRDFDHDVPDHRRAGLEIIEARAVVSLLRSAHSDDDYVCTRAVGEVSRENACRMRVQRLNQLESALRLRDDRLGQLMVDPPLDPLRKESRFGVIERELKFPLT
jgi:hypothetical protein